MLFTPTNKTSVELDENDRRRIWRFIAPPEPDTVDATHVTAGVVAYAPHSGADDLPLGDAHPHPEYYYTLSGNGDIWLPGRRVPVRAGDFFEVPPGTRHSITGSGGTVEMLYVSVRQPDAQPVAVASDHDCCCTPTDT